MPIKLNKTFKILKQALVAKQNFIKTLIKIFGCYISVRALWVSPMYCVIRKKRGWVEAPADHDQVMEPRAWTMAATARRLGKGKCAHRCSIQA
jgi:hypothetical protein